MTATDSVVERQVRSLLEGIVQDTESRRKSLLADASHQARALLHEARHQCRNRVAAALAEEQSAAAEAVARQRAELASSLRQRRQQLDNQRLAMAREVLGDALRARWASERSRGQWIRCLMTEAGSTLEGSDCVLEYPATLTDDAIRAMVVGTATGCQPSTLTFRPDPALEAGVRVRSGAACLDHSLAGLLSRFDELAADLLALFHRYGEDSADE